MNLVHKHLESLALIVHHLIKFEKQKNQQAELVGQSYKVYSDLFAQVTQVVNLISNFDLNRVDEVFNKEHRVVNNKKKNSSQILDI